jgi:hypothetical protein
MGTHVTRMRCKTIRAECVVYCIDEKISNSYLRHALCAAINLAHSSLSAPFMATQASRGARVSGQEQHIFFPLLPTLAVVGVGTGFSSVVIP